MEAHLHAQTTELEKMTVAFHVSHLDEQADKLHIILHQHFSII